MSTYDWAESRFEANCDVIHKISSEHLIDDYHRERRQKGIARRVEIRGQTDLRRDATVHGCGNPYCCELGHYAVCIDIPTRVVPNNRGNNILWTPEYVLPRMAFRLHSESGLTVHVGSVFRYHNGKRMLGHGKWEWKTDPVVRDVDTSLPCYFKFSFESVKLEAWVLCIFFISGFRRVSSLMVNGVIRWRLSRGFVLSVVGGRCVCLTGLRNRRRVRRFVSLVVSGGE